MSQRIAFGNFLCVFPAIIAASLLSPVYATTTTGSVSTVSLNPAVISGLDITVQGTEVTVKPGSCRIGDQVVEVTRSFRFIVDPPPAVPVQDEEYVLSSDAPNRWAGGTHLVGCKSQVTVLPGCLVPGSVQVKLADGTVMKAGSDYVLDEKWASLGRLPAGRITTDTRTLISYGINRMRIDALEIDSGGRVTLKRGVEKKTSPAIPEATSGTLRLAHLFWPYGASGLEAWQVFPIGAAFPEPDADEITRRRAMIPKTLEKLRAGGEFKIVAWGDSVTVGGDTSTPEAAFPNRFAALLGERYPQAQIQLINAGIGGSTTRDRLPGLDKDVVSHRPDLVIIEFVNDMELPAEVMMDNYAKAIARIREAGAEMIILTPHFTMAEWMGHPVPRGKETRPGVTRLRKIATDHNVALADASARWEHLEIEGIPYLVFLDNGINHPDDRGHDLFVRELLTFFPE